MKWRFLGKPKCKLCGRVLGEGAGTIRYRVADSDEVQEMKICKACGDDLEGNALTLEDFRE